MNHIFDINLEIWIVMGSILLIAIISTLINHRKKTKSHKTMCIRCRGIGFKTTYTSEKIPRTENVTVRDMWIKIKLLC